MDPWRSALDDGVGVDQQLSGAGDKSCVVGFSSCDEASVEIDQSLVPSEGGWERRGVEGAPQAPPAAGDVALPLVRSAVVVERRKTSERCGFLAADASELRHADDERERSPLADTRNAQHEVKPSGEVGMGAQLRDDPQQLG